MSEIQRWQDDGTGCSFPSEDGDMVLYEDHAKEISRLKEELEKAQENLTAAYLVGFHKRDDEVADLKTHVRDANKGAQTNSYIYRKLLDENGKLKEENEVLRQRNLSDPLMEATFKHLTLELEKAKGELAERDAGLKRIAEDDRAKDEVHCGCCVELRYELKKAKELTEAFDHSPFDLSPCRGCGKPTLCLPDGMGAYCEECGVKEAGK